MTKDTAEFVVWTESGEVDRLAKVVEAQAQEIEAIKTEVLAALEESKRLTAEIKKAFWWSAELTAISFDNHILEAWNAFLEVRERQAKEEQARLGESK